MSSVPSHPEPESQAPATETAQAASNAALAAAVRGGSGSMLRPWPAWFLPLVLVVAALALLSSLLLWQKLSSVQRELARQSADSGTVAIEARTTSRDAQELTRDTAARLAVLEVRVNEVALQRSQLEELIQSMSRSRDENLVVDIEAAVRLAQQQAILTGSVEPMLAALRSASQRVGRAAQPRLNSLQRAIERDIERIHSAKLTDIPAMLVKLDELVRLVDELPLANAAISIELAKERTRPPALPQAWWDRLWRSSLAELQGLVRVSRIDHPEASLLAPEQSFFLRENLKLVLLNARLGLISRHGDAVQADLDAAAAALLKYFDVSSRKTQAVTSALGQIRGQVRSLELPRIDGTLTALAVAAAGR